MAKHGNKEIVTVAMEKSVHDRLVKRQLQLGVDLGHRLSLSGVVEILFGAFDQTRVNVSRARVLRDVHGEREAQDEKWGPQNHPDGTGSRDYAGMADEARTACDAKHKSGRGTWADILKEEFYEALAESDQDKLRAELIQVAAVAVSWVEAIDKKQVSGE